MAKNIQISEDLFCKICRYHLLEDKSQADAIKQDLITKLDALKKRELYGKYKRGDEQARIDYLDMVGITEDFRF